jgi:hypothetical protein
MSKTPDWEVRYLKHGRYGLYLEGILEKEFDSFEECVQAYENMTEGCQN